MSQHSHPCKSGRGVSSVARSIKRGSPAWKRLQSYPKAVLEAYKSLLLPREQLAAR